MIMENIISLIKIDNLHPEPVTFDFCLNWEYSGHYKRKNKIKC
jgi:hypothetical protein